MAYIATSYLPTEEAASRSGIYRLLARIWLREMDREWVDELLSTPLRDSFQAAGGILPPDNDDQTIERLAIDYCRLFIGPKDHLPPYQSAWQTGQLQSTATASMKTFIEVVGYDLDRLPSGLMQDHLGAQLEVMGHILGQIANWDSDAAGLDQAWEIANSFFATHLLWPSNLLTTAIGHAETDFYQSSVTLTRNFLQSEMKAGSKGTITHH